MLMLVVANLQNLIPANISGYTVHPVLQYMRLHVYQLVYVYNHV